MAEPAGTRHPVAGVTIPLVTVLDEHGDPDAAAARPLLEHLAAGGITTLMFAGTNGEGPLLSTEAVRTYTVEVTARVARAGRAVRPGPGDRGRSRHPGDAAAPRPPRRPGPGRRGRAGPVLLPAHRERTARTLPDTAARHGLPVVVYNSPGYTGNPLTVPLMRRLFEEPSIVGLKDSSGDAALFAGFCGLADERSDFRVAQGAERQMARGLLTARPARCPGWACSRPRSASNCSSSRRRPTTRRAAERQRQLDRLTHIFGVRPGASGVVVVKTALHLLGLCPPQRRSTVPGLHRNRTRHPTRVAGRPGGPASPASHHRLSRRATRRRGPGLPPPRRLGRPGRPRMLRGPRPGAAVPGRAGPPGVPGRAGLGAGRCGRCAARSRTPPGSGGRSGTGWRIRRPRKPRRR